MSYGYRIRLSTEIFISLWKMFSRCCAFALSKCVQTAASELRLRAAIALWNRGNAHANPPSKLPGRWHRIVRGMKNFDETVAGKKFLNLSYLSSFMKDR